jgi:hypothetical protein
MDRLTVLLMWPLLFLLRLGLVGPASLSSLPGSCRTTRCRSVRSGSAGSSVA